MYITYTFCLTLGLLLTFPFYIIRFRKYIPTLRDRFGFIRVPQLERAIWIHAVSVGEVRAIENLLERVRSQFPGQPTVVSTATPAGQELARRRTDIVDHTFYFPLDLPSCVRRTLDRVSPQIVIIAETEIWPNFLRACKRKQVPVVMINGRISDRSFPRYRLVRRWLSRVFADYTIIGMQSEIDRHRIESIGADPQKVVVFGNLKYDVVNKTRPLEDTLDHLMQSWSQIWIAASTMPGEEEFVLDAFSLLSAKHLDLKLVLAPRHPDRCDAVESIVRKRGLNCLRRSSLGNPGDSVTLTEFGPKDRIRSTSPNLSVPDFPPILLLDSIGELASLFRYASVVFVGGSLVPKGGHNILEPARHQKPIVFGPHMENFRDISRLFLQDEAAIQIQNANELAPAIEKLLTNGDLASRLGQRALSIVEQNTGATDRVLKFLEPIEGRR